MFRSSGTPHISIQNGTQPEGVKISKELTLESPWIIQRHDTTETESTASDIPLQSLRKILHILAFNSVTLSSNKSSSSQNLEEMATHEFLDIIGKQLPRMKTVPLIMLFCPEPFLWLHYKVTKKRGVEVYS